MAEDFLNIPSKSGQDATNLALQSIATKLGVTTDALNSAVTLANKAGNDAIAKMAALEILFANLTTQQQQDAEVISARNTFASLKLRLDSMTAQSNDIVSEARVQFTTPSVSPSADLSTISDRTHYSGNVENATTGYPAYYGSIQGYKEVRAAYTYSWQTFRSPSDSKIYHRKALGASQWSEWSILAENSDLITHTSKLATQSGGVHGVVMEKGTWTPILSFGINPLVLSKAEGNFVRNGNTVFISATIDISDVGLGTGTLNMKGLPFTPDILSTMNIDRLVNVILNDKCYITNINVEKNTCTFSQSGNGTGFIGITNVNIQNDSKIRFSGTYII